MGDDDELGLLRQIVKIAGKPLHVPVVQCRVDLVQQTEGRRPHLQNGEVQCRRHEGFLAAGEQRDGLDLLAGRLDADLNAALQRRGRIFLPFVDDDPKTSEVLTKILFFAEDKKIKDPFILEQIRQ